MTDKPTLVSAVEIARAQAVDKTHFLNPNARRRNISLGDMTGLTGLGFHIIEVDPGHETTEHHVHHHEDECVYVLSGTATAHIGDEDHSIGAGDFLGYRAGGPAHSITNSGTEVLRCIVVGQRLPHDVGDYPRQGKRIYRNEGLTWDVVDNADIQTAGPNAGKK